MDLAFLLDRFSEPAVLALGGLAVGLLFGAFAQQSRFCLRAAVVEFVDGAPGPKLAIWLLTFSAAVLGTQMLVLADQAQLSEARQIASPQSLSGAALGGLMFGAGMVLARGCASRLLVLSATGNLRALLSGLVFAVVAQASLRGILRPMREWLAAGFITNEIGGNDLLVFTGASTEWAIGFALLWLVAGLLVASRVRVTTWQAVAACLAGLVVPFAWWFTASMAAQAFDPVQVEAVTFTGPSADTLMLVLSPPGGVLDFDVGLVPGVFLGSALAALMAREWRIVGFHDGPSMRRYLLGAALMGFGGMLAGGCAVGAGITGASVFAVTAWVALSAIWLSAGMTHYLIDGRGKTAAPSTVAAE
ncbi:sulfur transporter [Breoghania corrubedonensis]|uniref:Sulfur transporter n=1 Tax=Breoghania corrubedonensis TaxID=665038 RepID=A0A2T5VHW2_9HYPH|nr:YeeE/YedE family protein [Breoghania corrubedonensis]PTW63343.1 sulfur transporter [Breoghania corrubedonensis]